MKESFCQVGSQMRREINDFVSQSKHLHEVMIPFFNTRSGGVLFEKTETLLRSALPHYVREVEGLAAGSGLPYKTIMLLNMTGPPGKGEDSSNMILLSLRFR